MSLITTKDSGLSVGSGRVALWLGHGDLSAELHQLLLLFAESRCAAMGRIKGWDGGEKEVLCKVMGDVRRACSVVVVRSQALCLLDRLAHLGPGARAAAQR